MYASSMREEIMKDKLLYRIPEVAEDLSVSRSKVYELLKSGELRSVHIDTTRLVRACDLQAYVDSLAAAS
jgi:excisionase family DNA binding protein